MPAAQRGGATRREDAKDVRSKKKAKVKHAGRLEAGGRKRVE